LNDSHGPNLIAGRKKRGVYGAKGDYREDFRIARAVEREMQELLCNLLTALSEKRTCRLVSENNDNRYDFELQFFKQGLSPDWVHLTFEVKDDCRCADTGNIGVEYRCCGVPSGLNVSEADFYIYNAHTGPGEADRKILLFKTEDLKQAVRDSRYHRTATSYRDGPDRPADNYLFRLDEAEKIAVCVLDPDNPGSVRVLKDVIDAVLQERTAAKASLPQSASGI